MFELVASNDHTNSAALYAREERLGREETVAFDIPKLGPQETLSVVYLSGLPSVRQLRGGTPTAAELAQMLPRRAPLTVESYGRDTVEEARRARVSLLARKYGGSSSVENEARIDILTERLRKLSPRVTPTDLSTMGGIVDDLEKISSNLDEIRAKFGLE